tara:strand:- start:716 stop:1291 length:576 start_codon:yes stop_codon:yes gene_type:complete
MPVRRGVGHPMKLQQVSNRNFLSIVGFKFILNRCPKVDFLCNSANIPSITLGVAEQANYLRNIPVPGDKLQYDDLRITFMVDEDMENYLQLYQWMTSLGYPESINQYTELLNNKVEVENPNDPSNERSDATIQVLSSNYNPSVSIKFKDVFPYQLSGVPFTATADEQTYYTAEAAFKYTLYDVIDVNGKKV